MPFVVFWIFSFSLFADTLLSPWQLSVYAGAENWQYSVSSLRTKVYPRLSGQVEWWATRMFGLSLDTSGSMSLFRMEASGSSLPVRQDIWMQQFMALAKVNGRYFVSPNIALGLTGGYRFWNAMVDEQRVDSKIYTQVPSFNMHALDLGGEFLWLMPKQNVEAKLAFSVMPLMRYIEYPDMPGSYIWPIGLTGQFRVRCFFDENWFAVMDLRAQGVRGSFVGEGTRLRETGIRYQGAELTMFSANASLGVGLAL